MSLATQPTYVADFPKNLRVASKTGKQKNMRIRKSLIKDRKLDYCWLLS